MRVKGETAREEAEAEEDKQKAREAQGTNKKLGSELQRRSRKALKSIERSLFSPCSLRRVDEAGRVNGKEYAMKSMGREREYEGKHRSTLLYLLLRLSILSILSIPVIQEAAYEETGGRLASHRDLLARVKLPDSGVTFRITNTYTAK